MPGRVEEILKGKVFEFDIRNGFILAALASVTIPALMIFLSVALPAQVNRWANIILAAVNIPYMLFNLAGEAWMHMVFGFFVSLSVMHGNGPVQKDDKPRNEKFMKSMCA